MIVANILLGLIESGKEIPSRFAKIGKEKIPSVKNRIIFFDPSIPHCSTSCSDSKTRMNININYF